MPYDLRDALRPETERAALELNAAYKLVLAARRWRARVTEMFNRQGSSDAEFAALYHLAAAPAGLKQSELAERMAISGPTLTRQLDGLELRGRIRRSAIIGDRRSKLISLTPEGRDAVRGLDPIARTMREEIFAGLTDEEVQVFEGVLDRILERTHGV